MANWMTADGIAARYVVGEARLLEYAQRGNLPMRRRPAEEGGTLFDESVCARFFRPRVATVMTYREPKGPHMGILGVTALGAEANEPARSVRRRRPGAFATFGSGEHDAVHDALAELRKAAG